MTTAQPDLVALAHVAAEAIAAYHGTADDACAHLADLTQGRLDALSLLAFEASQALARLRGRDGLRDNAELEAMALLVCRGIVREAWALRVVQIASAEQARRDGTNYCGHCDKRGVDVDGEGRHVKCGGKVAGDG